MKDYDAVHAFVLWVYDARRFSSRSFLHRAPTMILSVFKMHSHPSFLKYEININSLIGVTAVPLFCAPSTPTLSPPPKHSSLQYRAASAARSKTCSVRQWHRYCPHRHYRLSHRFSTHPPASDHADGCTPDKGDGTPAQDPKPEAAATAAEDRRCFH